MPAIRYRFQVTDFIHDHSLRHLSATEAGLSAALARPKRIALGCIAALTALGWLTLGLMSTSSPLNWQMLCQPAALSGVDELALTAPMWMAMTLAMMLPTAGPMILTYAEIADTAARKREPVVSPLILATGYVAVWLGFALAAASLQWALGRAGVLDSGSIGRLIGGMIFI